MQICDSLRLKKINMPLANIDFLRTRQLVRYSDINKLIVSVNDQYRFSDILTFQSDGQRDTLRHTSTSNKPTLCDCEGPMSTRSCQQN